MRQKYIFSLFAAILMAAPLVSPAQANSLPQINMTLPTLPKIPELPSIAACSLQLPGDNSAGCHARVVADASGKAKNFVAPPGFSPAQFTAAYNIPAPAGHPIIAIVDAYSDPNIKNDLAIYDSQFGLPAFPACSGSIASSSAACFQIADQRGGTRYPFANSGWALEISLDVEVAHGGCPQCKILLVETDSNSFTNLLAGVSRAATMGAKVISNSWGGSEFKGENSYDNSLKLGLPITFSSGDSGYGVEYPAASPFVTAVGGTSLTLNSNNSYKTETAWNGAGSGCSAYEAKPAWQTDLGCPRRTVADVSADANPNTGAAIYDSYRFQGMAGWFEVGGTSLASPLVATAYATGNPIPTGTQANQMPYLNNFSLHDVLSGSNGSCSNYLCNAVTGYDGPTGLGSPNGPSGF